MKASSREKIYEALRQRVRGDVLVDEKTLTRDATDQSIYQIHPLTVVVPQDLEDVVATVRFAREEGIPLTPRAGGTSTTGSALGLGILLAFHKVGPMNRILGFDEVDGEPQVTVERGVLHDDLQRFLREQGFYLPADPSSRAICLLGGNIAAKASGPHALKHGSIDRYLRHLQFVTVEGEVVNTADETSIPSRIREGVLADANTVQRLEARKEMKLASGYNLFTFIRHQRMGDFVAQLMVGSVGTLGVITQATLRAEPYVEGHAAMLLYLRNLHEASDVVMLSS